MADNQPIATPQTTDPNLTAGNVQPVGTVPGSNATPTPATAGDQSTQQPGDNSNKPDASTPAAKSIPPNLVNNPQVPTQKLATQADANKNSPAPHHEMLRHAAEVLTGGPQYRTDVDANGTATRTRIEPSLAHLGLALALDVLKGGMAGAAQGSNGAKAFQAGQAQGEKQVAAVKQGNQEQDAQAKADQNHKLSVLKNNLELHQLAINVGQKDLEMNKAYTDSYADTAKMIESRPDLIKADIPEDKLAETQKQFPAYNFMYIPHGDPVAILDPKTGEQAVDANGVKMWGHNYYVIDGKAKGVLTQELQDQMYSIGKMRNPDGSRANVPTNSEYPMATIAKYSNLYAKVKTAEEQLEQHKNDILGDKAGPSVDLANSVASDKPLMGAVEEYSKHMGAGEDIDDVLASMTRAGKGDDAVRIMKFMGITHEDVKDYENEKAKEAKEATNLAKPKTEEEKKEIEARTDLLKTEKDTQSTIQSKNREDVQKSKAEIDEKEATKRHLDAETDKLIADKDGNSALVDAMGTGHVSAERIGYILAKKPELLDAVVKKYPDFSTSRAENYPKVYADYASNKKGTTGGQINNGATAFKHLKELLNLNTNWSHIPGTPAYNEYQNQLDTLVDELGQFYGNSTIPGLSSFKGTMNSQLPGTREVAIRRQAHSMAQKMDSFEQGWKNAAPSKAYEGPMPWYDDDAAAARQFLTGGTGTKVPTLTQEQKAATSFKAADGTTYNIDADGTFTAHGAKYKPSADGKHAQKVVTPAAK